MYRNTPCVVFGRNQNPWAECNLKAMHAANAQIVRRQSGGGAVYHDMGNTNYCVIMPKDVFKRRTHAEMVARALNQLDIAAEVNDRHDITVYRHKVSGSAFKLTSQRAYHHGTMLIDTDLDGLDEFLHTNKTQLNTAGTPSVRSSVTNLREYSYTIDHLSFCEAVHGEFRRLHDSENSSRAMIYVDEAFVENQPKIKEYREQLMTWDWIYGQTPKFTHTIEHTFDWAHIRITLHCHHGRVKSVELDASSMAYLPLLHHITAHWPECRYDNHELMSSWRDADIDATYTQEEIDDLRSWCANELG
ncbi:hypothetical protein BDF22DRAFT_663100 [Syncephalis plumigaleata]|nr:hypothetical protein BDF22DRAFT_663100 [Syncephalis plumigaleata]